MSNQKVYIVTKNADFTEGAGPMLTHSVWSTKQEAEKFIMSQRGIYGSEQRLSTYGTYPEKGEWAYNGFEIKETDILYNAAAHPEYDEFAKIKLEKEMAENMRKQALAKLFNEEKALLGLK